MLINFFDELETTDEKFLGLKYEGKKAKRITLNEKGKEVEEDVSHLYDLE